jgi:hypothetical protein
LHSFGNGALERSNQLGNGGEDRAVAGGERGGVAGILQPAFDRFSAIWRSSFLTRQGRAARIELSAVRDRNDSFQLRPAARAMNDVLGDINWGLGC